MTKRNTAGALILIVVQLTSSMVGYAEISTCATSPELKSELKSIQASYKYALQQDTPAERAQSFYTLMPVIKNLTERCPISQQVWATQALIAIELQQPHMGWKSGYFLERLNTNEIQSDIKNNILARLNANGWLEASPYIAAQFAKEGTNRESIPADQISNLSWAIKINPKTSYYESRAKIYQNLGNYDLAFSDFLAADRLERTDKSILNLANFLSLGSVADYSRAITYYDLLPNSTSALEGKYNIYYYILKDYNKAIDTANSLISQSPNTSSPYHKRAEANYAIGNLDNAYNDLILASKANPKYKSILYCKVLTEKGDAQYKHGNYLEALSYWDKARQQDSSFDDSKIQNLLGNLNMQAKNGDKALAYNLYKSYLKGTDGFPLDKQKAKDNLLLASNLGNLQAERALADNYREGINGFSKNTDVARQWYNRGFSQSNNPYFLAMLGKMDLYGEGLERPKTHQGLNTLNKAKSMGSQLATNELSEYRRRIRIKHANTRYTIKHNIKYSFEVAAVFTCAVTVGLSFFLLPLPCNVVYFPDYGKTP